MWNGWKKPLIVSGVVLIGISVLCMQSCRVWKEGTNIQASKTEIIREVIRDTFVKLETDKATFQALLECDSNGKVLMKQLLNYQAGNYLQPPEIGLEDNVLTATAQSDSIGIYLQLKDRYEYRENQQDSQTEKWVEVNVLTAWQKFRLGLANLMLIVLPLWLYVKFKK